MTGKRIRKGRLGGERLEERRPRGERPRRRVPRMAELERRVARLEDEVRWLRRAVAVVDEGAGASVVGTCPNCGRGVLVRRGSELRCSTCGYNRYL